MFSPLTLVLTYFGVTQAFYFSGRKIDCVVSEWSEWDGPLGFGEYERYRSVLVHPVNGGNACPELHETKSAGSPGTNAGVAVDCVVGEWGEWKGPLGFGEYERYRPILVQPVKAGKVCPDTYETKSNGSPGTNAGYNAGVNENNNVVNLPPINQTAKVLVSSFIGRDDGTSTSRFVRSSTSNIASYQKTRDILLLLDASGSIGVDNFRKALEGVSDLLGLLCPEPDPFLNPSIAYQQAAAISFDNTPTEIFPLSVMYPNVTLMSAIKRISYTGGGTCTGDAFRDAITFFASKNKGVRNSKYIQKEVLILTDGESNCGVNATQAAKELKDTIFSSADDKVKVYGLMIGFPSQRGRDEVRSYVSNPPGQHLFAVSDFNDLLSLVHESKRIVIEEKPLCIPIEVPSPDPLVG